MSRSSVIREMQRLSGVGGPHPDWHLPEAEKKPPVPKKTIKKCSTKAMSQNIRHYRHAGKEGPQAVAIAYSVLKKACGVTSKERMTPKEIVAKGGK